MEKMTELSELRSKLDLIDSQIVELYETRMQVCEKVAAYKISTGKKVLDKEREQEKIQTVKKMAHSPFMEQGIEELFQQIMSMSRKLQYRLLIQDGKKENLGFTPVDKIDTRNTKVVFQGAEGAYSQAAMNTFFPDSIKSYHVDTFRDAMQEIADHKADFAILPIENSTAGSVSEVYDLLMEYNNYIVGEQIIQIEHCLLGLPDTDMEQIKTVYSHPQSLMQSAGFLSEHPSWQQISMKNNAFAARKIQQDQDKTQAAIASEYAAGIYGLKVLKKGVNDSKTNETRFIVVTSIPEFCKEAGKISICFEVEHKSGSLYQILSHFIFNGLNMTKIESRPIENHNWEYRFFVDFEGNLEESAVQNALLGLKEETSRVKILGNY